MGSLWCLKYLSNSFWFSEAFFYFGLWFWKELGLCMVPKCTDRNNCKEAKSTRSYQNHVSNHLEWSDSQSLENIWRFLKCQRRYYQEIKNRFRNFNVYIFYTYIKWSFRSCKEYVFEALGIMHPYMLHSLHWKLIFQWFSCDKVPMVSQRV